MSAKQYEEMLFDKIGEPSKNNVSHHHITRTNNFVIGKNFLKIKKLENNI